VTTVALDEAVTGGALRTTHFFNGRLLTGEDLDREQRVQTTRVARLGTAVGDGVAFGLTVRPAPSSSAARPVVGVRAGLAVNRAGAALELSRDVDVVLARSGPRPGSEPGGLFADCQPYTASEYSTGAGVYLLSVAPAEAVEGLAPVSGLRNADAPCNTALAVEAVSFTLVRLALPLSELDAEKMLRNRVAYRMFAPDELVALERDPFGAPVRDHGLLDRLRGTCLSDDEVPLALIGWKAGRGIRFVDHWSVRRRVTRRDQWDRFGPQAGDRLRSEGEARFLQFQEQAADSVLDRSAASTVATEVFERLPAAGMLPVDGPTGTGFDEASFFAGLTTRGPFHVEEERAQALLRRSFLHPPIDLSLPELIWLYRVRENRDPSVAGAGTDRPYVIFASGHMPYLGSAQFDLSHWDFANYALPVW
jgi:hypothetical protein